MRDSPGLRALFNCHLWVSARLLPFFVGRQNMKAVRRYASPVGARPYAGLPASYIARRAVATARRPWLMRDRRCLREGLLGFRFLSLAGFEPELRFGIDTASAKAPHLAAHCWVCIDDRIVVSDRPPNMVEVLRLPQREPGAATACRAAR